MEKEKSIVNQKPEMTDAELANENERLFNIQKRLDRRVILNTTKIEKNEKIKDEIRDEWGLSDKPSPFSQARYDNASINADRLRVPSFQSHNTTRIIRDEFLKPHSAQLEDIARKEMDDSVLDENQRLFDMQNQFDGQVIANSPEIEKLTEEQEKLEVVQRESGLGSFVDGMRIADVGEKVQKLNTPKYQSDYLTRKVKDGFMKERGDQLQDIARREMESDTAPDEIAA